MTNIPYLLKILDTNKLSEVVANLDLPFLDIDLLLNDAEVAGQIEINRKKDKIKALVEPEISFDPELADKLLRTLQHYERRGTNATRGRINSLIKDPSSNIGYPWHEYLMALQYLIDSGQIEEQPITVPKAADRPVHKFVFLQFPDNPNEDWNRKVVNKWIADFHKTK